MEDFAGVYIDRKKDTEILLEHQRMIAAHLGGIAVESRLKSLLIQYHKINEWEEKSSRKKCSLFNQKIKNPGHGVMTAIRQIPDLWHRAKLDKLFLEHLANIINPLGATSVDYINVRYIPQSSADLNNEWKKSFDYVCGWLKQNEDVIS